MRPALILLAALLPLLAGCGRDTLHRGEAEIAASWTGLRTQYRARAERATALMELMQARAGQSRPGLAVMGDALARAERVPATDSLPDDPAGFAAMQRAQRDLGLALGRLLAAAEAEEAVGVDPAFQSLRAKLREAEHAIAVARGRYVRAVRDYNLAREAMPAKLTALALGYGPKANFTLEGGRDAAGVPPAGSEEPGVPQGKVAQPPTLITPER